MRDLSAVALGMCLPLMLACSSPAANDRGDQGPPGDDGPATDPPPDWPYLDVELGVGAGGTGGAGTGGAGPAPFLTEDFESDLDSSVWQPNSGYPGDAFARSTDNPRSGAWSARFTFHGSLDPNADASVELRFDLPDNLSEIWTEWYMWYPDGSEAIDGGAATGAPYAHRQVSPHNNKFFRIWGDDYGDCAKMGASTWSVDGTADQWGGEHWYWDGESNWPMGQGFLPTAGFIDATRVGRWLRIRQHYKLGTGANDRAVEMWLDDTQLISATNVVNNPSSCNGYWNEGYILGWSNSGFDATTHIWIDDVRFYDIDPQW